MSNHFIAKHTGVHFLDQKEDLILTELLFVALTQPSCDLSKVMIDISTLLDDRNAFVDEGLHIPIFKYRKVPFCRTTTVEVVFVGPHGSMEVQLRLYGSNLTRKFRENIQKFKIFV